MKKGTYKIARYSNTGGYESFEVEGYIVPIVSNIKHLDGQKVGICRAQFGGWTATHIKTGYAIGHGGTRMEALNVAKESLITKWNKLRNKKGIDKYPLAKVN